jgi:protein-S-isoprenylcysteine O-methyltransferase Ste14
MLDEKVGERMFAVSMNASFVLGWIFTVVGTAARLAAFRELGKLFTYDLALRNNHKLVTTGPYSIVRHPSYTAALVTWAGVSICLFGEGSWLSETGMLSTTLWKVASTIWFTDIVWVAFNFIRRTYLEDDFIREQFKDQWDEWARQVPYKLVPAIF